MAVNREVRRVEQALYAWTTSRLDAQSEALIRAWVEAWEEVEAEVEAALYELVAAAANGRVTRTQMLRSQRLQAALGRMADALERAVGRQVEILTADLMAEIRRVADAEAAMLAAQLPAQIGTAAASLPVSVSVIGASSDQIAAIVRRATEQITKVTYPISAEAYAAIRRQLLRGIAVGSNPRTVARRAVQAVEGAFHGGLSRALTIARTEMLTAHRTAAQVVDLANADIVTEWQWEAHLGPRTCRSCLANHGKRFPIETPGPNDHPSGRCSRVPITKSWEELGIAGVREPKPLAGRDAEAYFNRLSESNQRAILGNRGYEAWKAGKYPMSAWTEERENPGWHAAWYATTPPKVA